MTEPRKIYLSRFEDKYIRPRDVAAGISVNYILYEDKKLVKLGGVN